jgi:hypothetical protein
VYRFYSTYFGGRRGSTYPRLRSRRFRRGSTRALARNGTSGSAAPSREDLFEGWAEL